MNPTQKQFSLNRGASRKQIPISIFDGAQPVMKEAQRRTGRGHWGCIEKLAKLLLVKPPLSQDEVFLVLPEYKYVKGDLHA